MPVIGIAEFHTQGFSVAKRIFQFAFEIVFALFVENAGNRIDEIENEKGERGGIRLKLLENKINASKKSVASKN